jgi:SPP1 family predicted phage head-tail adaptor
MLGTLNQRATIAAQTLTPDGGGGYSESWDVVATVWARLEPVSGQDRYTADKLESRARHKLILRRSSAFAAGQRATIGTRVFAVRAVLDDGPQSALMILLCEELP